MEKKELLIKIGFSSQFLEHLENAENLNIKHLNNDAFSNENFDFSVHDTSVLYMENQLKKDFCDLEIRQ